MDVVAAFSGFSVNNLEVAKQFYTEKLGCTAVDQMGGAELTLPTGAKLWVYEKPNHEPATYTILNFVVDDIDAAVNELAGHGVTFEKYPDMNQDEKGIARGKTEGMGPNIAWFKDSAGNIVSVLEI